jgi:hypothetical protein
VSGGNPDNQPISIYEHTAEAIELPLLAQVRSTDWL